MVQSLAKEVLSSLSADKAASISTDEIALKWVNECSGRPLFNAARGESCIGSSICIGKLNVIERHHYVSVGLTSLYRRFIEQGFEEISAVLRGYCFLNIATDPFKLARRYRVLRKHPVHHSFVVSLLVSLMQSAG